MPGPESESVSDLLAALYAGLLEPDPWSGFLDALARATHSTHANLLLLRPESAAPTTLIISPGADPDLTRAYFSESYSEDPFVGLPEGEVVAFDDFVAKDTIPPGFAHYLDLSGGTQILGLDIHSANGAEARFRLTRNERTAPAFTALERALLQEITPHLRIALALFSRLEANRAVQGVYRVAIERVAMALFLIDADGRLLRNNDVGRALLDEKSGVTLDARQHLRLEPATAQHRLAELLREPPADGTTRRLILRGRGGKELPAIAHALGQPVFATDREPAVALFVTDPARPGTITPDALRDLFQLTAQEAILAATLAEGTSLIDAAAHMGIAHNTARAHLRMIFTKTGVRRQAELVHLIQSIAGIVSTP